jgi:hypothetical protein
MPATIATAHTSLPEITRAPYRTGGPPSGRMRSIFSRR